jgi:hypothetical protein
MMSETENTDNRSSRGTCCLPDGRRVQYSLKTRKGVQHYFVVFANPDPRGYRLEKTTKETNKKRANAAATQIIKEAYTPNLIDQNEPWESAITKMKQKMESQNLRPRSIGDYVDMLSLLRAVFPKSHGPNDITAQMSARFKDVRSTAVEAVTLAGNLNKLSVIWQKWLKNECKLVTSNPWEDIEKPKVDEPQPRYIETNERESFFAWLLKRWDGWRLPVLFFEVSLHVGRRIFQMASLPSECLKDGRLNFESRTCKGRRNECARVPDKIYQDLLNLAGPEFLWERFSEQLAAIYRQRNQRGYVKGFTPSRFKRWLQGQVTDYNQANVNKPGFRAFTAHNFRDTAMTNAWDADVPIDKAAIAFGCNAGTMKKHYIRKDNVAIGDDVFAKIQARQQKLGNQALPGGEDPASTVGGT